MRRFFFGKTKVMAKALGQTPAEEHLANLSQLTEYLNGNVGLLFTNREPSEIIEYFANYSQTDFARAGVVATQTFTVPAGVVHSRGGEVPEDEDVPLAHSMETTIRKWGMPTRLDKGNLSSTYAVKAGPNLALCSRFDFNFYSYESELQLGCELWRMRNMADVEWAVKRLRPDWKRPTVSPNDDVSGVLKARVDQDWRVGVLWEGRIKELLFTLGASLDLKKREQIFRSIGIELQYAS